MADLDSTPASPTSPTETQQTAAVVYNPIKVDIDALRAAVDSAAADAGWGESVWLETSIDDVGQKVTREAVDLGVDLVITAGGDGTVRAVAEALRGSGIPLALLPSGTGNLLARNLKLTLNDMPGSVIAAFEGVDRPIDLGVIDIERENRTRDRHVFVVLAGMGIDAKMIANTDDDLKAKAGIAAYVSAITKSLRDPHELHMQFKLDDEPTKRATVHTVMIGNCGSLPANILLMPNAVVDDGLFDLLLMRPGGLFGWIRVWVKVAWLNGIVRRTKAGRALAGEHRNDGDLHYRTGTRFVARLSRPEEIELDGDGFGKATAFNAWIEPGALKVRVPADAD
ncbi:diacylglycerol kinase [Subtercola sp. Z020]|uniref:diacylglycerol/lipid kinase family protein n=1 Tax=Subtercola sp. Z020 TaxID=2080582 RepID=UPI000CE91EE2|nr:diacylglycerol kinase family protein [Subtercola sp. Z020]PPF90094.1 diacylglycerol kinase [Subtercola sp. Z020]